MLKRGLALLVIVLGTVLPLQAQSDGLQHLDEEILRTLYSWDAPLFTGYMELVDATAYPLFLGAIPATWLYALHTGQRADLHLATSLLVAEGAAFVLTTGIKELIRRPRPYQALPDIRPRSRSRNVESPYGFPSGHTTVAFSIATVYVLRYRKWYVTLPAAAWALSIGISRIWAGMHYPTDVLAGMGLGIAVGVITFRVTEHLLK